MSTEPRVPDAPPGDRRPVTVHKLAEMKQLGQPIVMITAYDFPSAQVAEESGVDMVLVGAEAVVENGGVINKLGTYQVGKHS